MISVRLWNNWPEKREVLKNRSCTKRAWHPWLVYDDKDKANTLNSFFTTEGKKLASKFTPASGTGSPQLLISMMKYPLKTNSVYTNYNVNFRKAHGLDNLGSLSTRDLEDDAAVRSTKAWVWRRRSPAKFNLFKRGCCFDKTPPFSVPDTVLYLLCYGKF